MPYGAATLNTVVNPSDHKPLWIAFVVPLPRAFAHAGGTRRSGALTMILTLPQPCAGVLARERTSWAVAGGEVLAASGVAAVVVVPHLLPNGNARRAR